MPKQSNPGVRGHDHKGNHVQGAANAGPALKRRARRGESSRVVDDQRASDSPKRLVIDDASVNAADRQSGSSVSPAFQLNPIGGVSPFAPTIAMGRVCFGPVARPLDELVLEIRETHRRRQDFHRAEKSLTLQIKAIERRLSPAADHMTPGSSLLATAGSDDSNERRLATAATTMTPIGGLQSTIDLKPGQAPTAEDDVSPATLVRAASALSERRSRGALLDTAPSLRLRSAPDIEYHSSNAPAEVFPTASLRSASDPPRGSTTASLVVTPIEPVRSSIDPKEHRGTIHPPFDAHVEYDRAAIFDETEEDGDSRKRNDSLPSNGDAVFFATLPLQEARAVLRKHRLKVERDLTALAMDLPVYTFVQNLHGFGALGLAQIVGEAGNLSKYANPAKLWKRMGLAVINGKSQRRVTGDGALEQGYSPTRRAIMFCIGDALLKKQNAYRDLYLIRKAREMEKVPEGPKILWHRRAQRYCEKRLLRELWRAWTQASSRA